MGQAHEGHAPSVPAEDFGGIGLARGYFEESVVVEGGLLVRIWMLLPDRELGFIHVYVHGEFVGSADAANGLIHQRKVGGTNHVGGVRES